MPCTTTYSPFSSTDNVHHRHFYVYHCNNAPGLVFKSHLKLAPNSPRWYNPSLFDCVRHRLISNDRYELFPDDPRVCRPRLGSRRCCRLPREPRSLGPCLQGYFVRYARDLRRRCRGTFPHPNQTPYSIVDQEYIWGNVFQIYRCWVIWNRDWKVIVLPSMLWIVSVSE